MIKFAILDNDVSKPFISYVLNSQLGKTYFKRNRIGAIQGNITIPVIKSCPLPLPPLEKQNEIAAHIQAIRDQAKQLRAEAAAGLEQAKQEVEAMILGGTQ
jgi:restriction endonuclease S subunit